MNLSIEHRSTYEYDQPVVHGLQRLRLEPHATSSQTVFEWTIEITGGTKQVDYSDHFGNLTQLVKIDAGATTVEIIARGLVETTDSAGVVAADPGMVPLWLFRRSTDLTTAGAGVEALVAELPEGDDRLARLHALSNLIAERVVYETGRSDSTNTAEDALASGAGVCQDHAHVFVSAARTMGESARYVSGYLLTPDNPDQEAGHAWAEAWVEGLGWVGFDASNGISPDERYVRLALGRDYHDASPISGIRFGSAGESLDVALRVEQ